MMHHLDNLIKISVVVTTLRWFDVWLPSEHGPFGLAIGATGFCLLLILIHGVGFITSAIRRQREGEGK